MEPEAKHKYIKKSVNDKDIYVATNIKSKNEKRSIIIDVTGFWIFKKLVARVKDRL